MAPDTAAHRPSVRMEQVAMQGARYWGTCSCGWTSPARFADREVAQQAADRHAAPRVYEAATHA